MAKVTTQCQPHVAELSGSQGGYSSAAMFIDFDVHLKLLLQQAKLLGQMCVVCVALKAANSN